MPWGLPQRPSPHRISHTGVILRVTRKTIHNVVSSIFIFIFRVAYAPALLRLLPCSAVDALTHVVHLSRSGARAARAVERAAVDSTHCARIALGVAPPAKVRFIRMARALQTFPDIISTSAPIEAAQV